MIKDVHILKNTLVLILKRAIEFSQNFTVENMENLENVKSIAKSNLKVCLIGSIKSFRYEVILQIVYR